MTQSKKEMKAQLINVLSKQFKTKYEDKIDRLSKRVDSLSEKNIELEKKVRELSIRNEELEQKNNQYEDWIQRLQDFCNMTDEDRKREIESLKIRQKTIREMNDTFSPYLNLFKMVFNA